MSPERAQATAGDSGISNIETRATSGAKSRTARRACRTAQGFTSCSAAFAASRSLVRTGYSAASTVTDRAADEQPHLVTAPAHDSSVASSR